MDPLSPLDALFLEAEDADPHTSMAIASVAVFAGPAPTYGEFLAHLRDRLPLVPRYRQKVRTVPWNLGAPRWVDAPGFDLTWHLRQTALPAPGDDDQLRALVGRVLSQRLDRDRPLWEYWLVDGLRDGYWALISKAHHCMVDGVSGTDLYRVVFDLSPRPRAAPEQPDRWQPSPEPDEARLAAAALRDLVTAPVRTGRAALDAVRAPGRTARRLADAASGARRFAADLVTPADATVSGRIGRHRRFAWARGTRDDVTVVREAFGGTVNDVVLAAVTIGFRQMLLARGEQPGPHTIRSLVPVNLRAPGEESIYDNRVSGMVADLPVHLADPVAQLAAVRGTLAELKASREAEAGRLLLELARYEPFPLFSWPARLVFAHPYRVVTTVTTNVPGPRVPLYALGRRAVEIIPYVPVANPVRLGVSIFTYCDAVTFGVTGDYDTARDVDVLADGIGQGLAALVKAAREQAHPA